jgi:hypothetical protein
VTSTRFAPRFALVFGCLGFLLSLGMGAESRAQSMGPYFLGIPYGTTFVGDPLFDETKFDLFYPVGGCPKIGSCSSAPMPLAVLIHGGNTNSPSLNPPQLASLPLALLAQGFVVAIPSFHELDLVAGEEFVNATRDIARLIQFLRLYHFVVNIDPQRVFAQGHSGGGFHALYLGLNEDFQDLQSPDPVLHQSSRPDFVVPWGAPTDWNCFDFPNAANNFFSKLIFGEPHPVNISAQEKQDKAPTWWLANPELYGRTTTPPMCLVYNLGMQSACGAITDVHDGTMGILMMDGIESLCLSSRAGQPFCSDSILMTTAHGAGIPTIVSWMTAMAFGR